MTERLSKREQARIERLEAARKASSPEPSALPRENDLEQPPSPAQPRSGRVYSKVADGRTANAATRLQMEGLRGGLLAEVDQLRAEVSELRPYKEAAQGDAEISIYIDPREVAPTRYFNRLDASTSVEEPQFQRLLQDIRSTKGNKVPAGVRPYSGSNNAYKYEVIYGSRRLAACKIAVEDDPDVRFRAVLERVADEDEAQLLQQVENRLRSDPAVIEQGLSLRSYFLQRFGANTNGTPVVPDGAVKHVAAKLGLNSKYVSRLLLAASIPERVLACLKDPRGMTLKVALELARACRDDMEGVSRRLKTLPSNLSTKAAAQYLTGNTATRVVSEISLPLAQIKDREEFMVELQALVRKYGVEIELPGGGLERG